MDEAGFGPMLGPLCVGMTALRVHEWDPESGAPDVWSLLAPEVCRTAKDAKGGRLAVADSKALKGSNTLKNAPPASASRTRRAGVRRHDGVGVGGRPCAARADGDGAGGLRVAAGRPDCAPAGLVPGRAVDRGERDAQGVRARGHRGARSALPGHRGGGVQPRGRAVGLEGAATELALVEHMARIRERWGGDDHVRVVCDRQSGRLDYRDLMRRVWGSGVEELERSNRVSRYCVGERVGVQFVPEAEDAHFPVALASMLAKLMRELAMIRFNRYWAARVPELKPTAGYVQDARRWLDDAGDAVSADDRRAMVRIA